MSPDYQWGTAEFQNKDERYKQRKEAQPLIHPLVVAMFTTHHPVITTHPSGGNAVTACHSPCSPDVAGLGGQENLKALANSNLVNEWMQRCRPSNSSLTDNRFGNVVAQLMAWQQTTVRCDCAGVGGQVFFSSEIGQQWSKYPKVGQKKCGVEHPNSSKNGQK